MPIKRPENKDTAHITEDVIDLFIRMEAQKGTPDDLRLLMSWASTHPEKLEAFEALNDIWESVGEVEPDKKIILEPKTAYSPNNDPKSTGLFQGLIAIAATVLFIFGFYLYQISNSLVYQTQIGELKQISLADGSQIHLNGDSTVTVDYIPETRYLKMDKGEAFFEVAPDKNRTFIVEVGDILVKAVGTAFNIEYIRGNVIVSVVEGTVEVKLSEAAHENPAQDFQTISARGGDIVKYKKASVLRNFPKNTKKDETTLVMNEGGAGQALAWRKGILNFNGIPLNIAVEKINRQSVKQVVLADTRLSNLPIYGSFYIDHVKSFVDAIEVLYPIQHIETKKGYILSRNDH